MKRLVLSILVLLAMGTLLYAGGQSEESTDAAGTAATKTVELKFQSLQEGTIPRIAAEKFIELVNAKTDYEVKAKFFLQGEIAKAGETIEAIRGGMLDMANLSPSWTTAWSPKLGLFEMPFLWSDMEHFQTYIVDQGGGEKLGKTLTEKTGVIPLVWYSTGFRWMFFKDRINSIDDLRKVKMRSPGGQIFLDMMKIIGINAVTVPWSEVFTALNTGLVEAVESPPALAYDSRFHEVIRYAWPSRHMMGLQFILIGAKQWESLPDEVKAAMKDAAYETSYYMYGMTPLLTNKAVKAMQEENGVEVIYDVDRNELEPLFIEYQTEWARANDAMDMLEEILALR